MKNTALNIELTRRVTRGNSELNRLIANYFATGSPEKLDKFLRSAPASGTALLELSRKHGGSFGDFVDAVIRGEYLWHGIGWNAGEIWRDMWTIGIESARLSILLVRIGPDIATSVSLGCLGFEVTEIVSHYSFDGFGPVETYTGTDGSSGILGGNEEPDCEFPDTEILYGL